jgi:hypothetical protein
MVIALVLLSLAMIAGGGFAAVQGWEIVLLERGWALMISGSVTAACGAVLLGIAAAVARLGKIRSEFAQWRDMTASREVAYPQPPSLESGDAAAAALAGGALAGPDMHSPVEGAAETQAALPPFLRPEGQEEAEESRDREALETVLKAERPSEPAGGARHHRPRLPDDLFKDRDPHFGTDAFSRADRENSTGPESLDAPGADKAADLSAERTPAAGEGPDVEAPSGPVTVIGTYTSGENRYVMYSDGSIEAETPQGVFRFGSLDQLKEFIASGGEGNPTVT